jgi:tripartite-type tricarboxylate transporter receptor subunit TctC
MNDPIRRALAATFTAAALVAAMPGHAQEAPGYPARPVRIFTPTAAGGNIDIMARALADKLASAWGQGVVVEPRPGANGMLAAGAAAKAAPDGHTLLFSHSALLQNLLLQANPPYKLAELQPVSMLALFPIAYGVNTSLGVNSLAELVALARAKPRTLSFGSYGTGSGAHVIGAALNRAAGIDLTHVAYKGEVPAVTDMMSGVVSSAYGSVGYMARQVGSGKVKLIAVASTGRLKAFPDVPTFAEAGYPALNLPGWGGLFVPAGTPAPVLARLNAEVVRAIAAPDMAEKINGMGFVPVASSVESFTAAIKSEYDKWEAAIRENQIRLE